MHRPKRYAVLTVALLLTVILSPLPLSAADSIESAGVGVGVTAGNILFVPAKAAALFLGLTGGALSFVLTGGNADLTAQIWKDVTEGPYLITPGVARTAIGERPELQKR